MNEHRFFELLSAYGADVRRWPENEQAPAEAFLETASHRVKDIWESERAFDTVLAAERDAPAPIRLEARILESLAPVRRASPRMGGWLWARRHAAAGGVVAASLLMGVAAGYAAEPSVQMADDYGAMLSLSGAGATSVFLSAMNDPGVREE